MANLRAIVQQRARIPAKIHDLEAATRSQNVTAAPGPVGGPVIVQYDATQSAAPVIAAPSGRRPPRAAANCANAGALAPSPITKASEARQPRSVSEPGRRIQSDQNRGHQSASGPAASDAGDGRPSRQQAKAQASLVRAKISDVAPPVDHSGVGKVPAYLRKRQQEMADAKRRAARPASPTAPPGYRKVPDGEKQATLAVLRQRKTEVESAQKKLPFKIETAGQKQREKDLSDRVGHLDKLLGMFGQPVVFIPADASPIATNAPSSSPPPTLSNRDSGARHPRIREDGPAVSEISHDSRSSRQGYGQSAAIAMEEHVATAHPASLETGHRDGSLLSQARTNAVRQQMCAAPPPWSDARSQSSCNVNTAVKIMAPPGGVSSLCLSHS